MSPAALPPLTLVSHELCPYVQRAAIVLAEKGVPFERRWVDLANKPAWFLAVSPLGKTPVLLAGGEPVFESAVICEYLDEIAGPKLHADDALQRAKHSAWIEVGSALLASIWGFYTAPDEVALEARRADIASKLAQVEGTLADGGPFFAGAKFMLVDAAFAPVFGYFDAFEEIGEESFFAALPKTRAWRAALAARASVQQAAGPRYRTSLMHFLANRGGELSRRMGAYAASG